MKIDKKLDSMIQKLVARELKKIDFDVLLEKVFKRVFKKFPKLRSKK